MPKVLVKIKKIDEKTLEEYEVPKRYRENCLKS